MQPAAHRALPCMRMLMPSLSDIRASVCVRALPWALMRSFFASSHRQGTLIGLPCRLGLAPLGFDFDVCNLEVDGKAQLSTLAGTCQAWEFLGKVRIVGGVFGL